MKKLFFHFALLIFLAACQDQAETAEPLEGRGDTTAVNSQSMPSEFADPKYMDMGKQLMQQFADENIDAYGGHFADNAVYQWSSGDSLTGKQAIVDYWKQRFTNVIDTISMSNDIWLPIKVNQPQQGPDMPGVWLIGWHQVNVKYKNGKELQFWVHTDYHFNENDKIDRAVQYLDRAPINAALGTN